MERLIQNQRESNRSYKADNTWRDRIIKTWGAGERQTERKQKSIAPFYLIRIMPLQEVILIFSETLVHDRCFFYFIGFIGNSEGTSYEIKGTACRAGDAHSHEDEEGRKRPRLARKCAKAHSFYIK